MNIDLLGIHLTWTRHHDDGSTDTDVTYLNPTMDQVVHPAGPDADPDGSHEAAISAAHALLGEHLNPTVSTQTGPVTSPVVTTETPEAAPEVTPVTTSTTGAAETTVVYPPTSTYGSPVVLDAPHRDLFGEVDEIHPTSPTSTTASASSTYTIPMTPEGVSVDVVPAESTGDTAPTTE